MSMAAGLARTRLPDRGILGIHAVMTHLDRANVQPVWATASRRVLRTSSCEVWSLSPNDEAYTSFLKSLAVRPGNGLDHGIRSLTPNHLSVVLLVRFDGDISCLFGADLERRGWAAVLSNHTRPWARCSVFKVPHHGSANAHHPGVWDELLEPDPIAILAPWRRGGGALPKERDVRRILEHTPNAYATAAVPDGTVSRDRWVKKRLKNVGARFAPESRLPGMIRLRRSMAGEDSWRVELVGSACRLKDFAA